MIFIQSCSRLGCFCRLWLMIIDTLYIQRANVELCHVACHDDVIKWKHFPRYLPGIHRSSVNSPYKGQWRGASMSSLICAGTNGWGNNRDAGGLRRHRAHYDVTLTLSQCTLAEPVYTRMPLECHWLTQWTLGYHWATQRILVRYKGTPLEKLSWNSPTLECHWRNLVETAPHWDATGETNFCSLCWNTTGETATAHTHPGTYSQAE